MERNKNKSVPFHCCLSMLFVSFISLDKLFTDSERVQLFIRLHNGKNSSCDGGGD